MDTPLETTDDTRQQRVLVLTARSTEYETCLNNNDFQEHLHQNHSYYRLESHEWDIRLTHTGVGPDSTRSTLNKLEGIVEPDFILIAGTAGGLSKDLDRDSLYLPTAVRSPDSTDWFHPETRILQWLMGVLQESLDGDRTFRSGPLLSVEEPVTDPDNRRSLREKHQALAVDMETSPIVDYFNNTPEELPGWGVIRVITDTPDDQSLERIKQNQSRGADLTGRVLDAVLNNLLTA